ncbi:MAG: hypothetical protein O3B24_01965 [Verrucomicrobia bacterium]|nr:hypothetical protein [Verrucomicrobiota bacterium]
MAGTPRTFVGFGFGPIQAGLFLLEAFRAGAFDRLVVAEIVPETVDALRRAGGTYTVNVALPDGVVPQTVRGITVLNPREPAEREALVDAIADAQEIATALPSVVVFRDAAPAAVTSVLAEGLQRKETREGPRAVVYTGENHNHAAALLTAALDARGAPRDRVACLNTVIGKMSGVLSGDDAKGLAPFVPDATRAFLVEAFNRIQISRVPWDGFTRGLATFEEKEDLLPFEEAKLYGHNAVHALLGYHLWHRGARTLAEAAHDPALMRCARNAFLKESGAALCQRHAGRDPLFSPEGWRHYADDLLARMVNPHLRDAVSRVTRDPRRKLGWHDRLVGTIRLAMQAGLAAPRFAWAARLAADALATEDDRPLPERLRAAWADDAPDGREAERVIGFIEGAKYED